MQNRDIVTIGASTGGPAALRQTLAVLPADLAATVLIVQHVSVESPRLLPQILAASGKLPVEFAVDGDEPATGRVYVAPPDRHLLIDGEKRLRLSRGPKENRARPAIDPTFRSVALAYGSRAIGVVLTGYLDDGASGLRAIDLGGGVCLVQSPAGAEASSMPQAALRLVRRAHAIPLSELGAAIAVLVAQPAGDAPAMPHPTAREIEIEAAIAAGDRVALAGTGVFDKPSPLTCPDCHGTLFQIDSDAPLQRFRCHTGHAFTIDTLLAAVREQNENALWSAMRALQEEAILTRHMADHAESQGDAPRAARLLVEAERAARAADRIRFLEKDDS